MPPRVSSLVHEIIAHVLGSKKEEDCNILIQGSPTLSYCVLPYGISVVRKVMLVIMESSNDLGT